MASSEVARRGRSPAIVARAARFFLLLFGLAVWNWAAIGVGGQPAFDGDLELRVQQLVQRLRDDDVAARDRAEQQLVELGPNILPLLPTTPSPTELPADAGARLARVRETLRMRRAQEVGRASQVSLRGRLSLAQLLEEVHRQTGNRLIDYRRELGGEASELQLGVDAVRREFWPAMDGLLDEAGLAWYPTSGKPRVLALQSARPGQVSRVAEACYRGAFRLAITEVLAQKSLRIPRDAGLAVRLELLWEPRLAPILVRQALVDVSAEDDASRLLNHSDSAASIEVPVQPSVAGTNLTLHLPLPARDASRLKRLQGRLVVVTPGPEATLEFDQLESLDAKPRVRKLPSGAQVALEEVRRVGDTVTCLVSLRLPSSSPPLESHLDWTRRNVVYLISPDGRRIEEPVIERYREGEREVAHAYLFPVSGDLRGYRLVYRSPDSLVEVPVEYEFTDIDLP